MAMMADPLNIDPENEQFWDGEEGPQENFFPVEELDKPGCDARSELARLSLYRQFDPLIAGRPSVMTCERPERVSPSATGTASAHSNRHGGDSEDLLSWNSPIARTHGDGREATEDLCDLSGKQSDNPSSSFSKTPTSKKSVEGKHPERKSANRSVHDLHSEEQILEKDRIIALKEEEMARMKEEHFKEMEALKKKFEEQTTYVESVKKILSEYEKTMSQLVAEKEKCEKQSNAARVKAEQERDQALEDLNRTENAFNAVHAKYERMKAMVDALKSNEESLKVKYEEYEQLVERQKLKYEQLKQQVQEKLTTANEELSRMERDKEVQISSLTAALRKNEILVSSQQKRLDEKDSTIQELTQVLDQLVQKCNQ